MVCWIIIVGKSEGKNYENTNKIKFFLKERERRERERKVILFGTTYSD